MRVLVACERSGRVRDAFNERGHDAVSCDIEDTAVPGPHIKGDVRPVLRDKWDLVIAFPPCTDLAYVNARHLEEKRRDGRTRAGLRFFIECLLANAPMVCVENPRGIPQEWFRVTQVIQPWEFGHPYTKATCLWLKGLPPLMPAFSGQIQPTESWTNRNDLKSDRAKVRSETFPGVARAMAEQWGTM